MSTYYVDTAVGDDANAGTSEGAGNAWATIDKAMNTVAAGDKVWVKASGNYNETATIDTVGQIASQIEFEGYTSTPGDNGKVTIDGQSTRTNCMVYGSSSAVYYIIKNFIFTGATGDGFETVNGDAIVFFNCEFHTNGGVGCEVDNDCFFISCEFYSNTSSGLVAGQAIHLAGCVIYSNGSTAVSTSQQIYMYKCLIYSTASGFNGVSTGILRQIIGCTLDGENSTATALLGTSPGSSLILDNIIYDWGNGVLANSGGRDAERFYGFNLMNSNSSNDYFYTGETIGIQDVTSAPAFTDEANDDYTLATGSAAIDSGISPGGIT